MAASRAPTGQMHLDSWRCTSVNCKRKSQKMRRLLVGQVHEGNPFVVFHLWRLFEISATSIARHADGHEADMICSICTRRMPHCLPTLSNAILWVRLLLPPPTLLFTSARGSKDSELLGSVHGCRRRRPRIRQVFRCLQVSSFVGSSGYFV